MSAGFAEQTRRVLGEYVTANQIRAWVIGITIAWMGIGAIAGVGFGLSAEDTLLTAGAAVAAFYAVCSIAVEWRNYKAGTNDPTDPLEYGLHLTSNIAAPLIAALALAVFKAQIPDLGTWTWAGVVIGVVGGLGYVGWSITRP